MELYLASRSINFASGVLAVKRLIAILLFSLMLGGCGGNDYDEDDAYEDGYEGGTLGSSKYEDAYLDGQKDSYCDWLKCAIESGDQPRSNWSSSGCGSWGSSYGC